MYTANKRETFHPARREGKFTLTGKSENTIPTSLKSGCLMRIEEKSRAIKPLKTKNCLFVSLAFMLVALHSLCLAAPPVAHINVEPGTTVKVGQEVFFDGSGSTDDLDKLVNEDDNLSNPFRWDFGDGYAMNAEGSSYFHPDDGGVTATHFYMRPGTYPVTLTVTDRDGESGTATVTITVEGEYPKLPPMPSVQQILELKFEDSLKDTSGNNLTASWVGTGSYVDGIEGRAADLTNRAHIEVLNSPLLDGMNELTVSFWAKKATSDSYGSLLEKGSAYYISIGPDVRFFEGSIYTSGGRGRAYTFAAYDVDKTIWNHYALTYDGSLIRISLNGEEFASTEFSGTISSTAGNLLIGKRPNAADVFNGYIDEVKIYNRALTPKELFVGFELWHADFHGHIAQYIYPQIPSVFTADPTNKIIATIAGDTGFSKLLLDKTNLQPEEKFLLNNSELPAGNYTLTAQILDSGSTVLAEITEEFTKPYDGIPKVGIDENNAIRIDGELFFPITPWGLGWSKYQDWKQEKGINALHGVNWDPVRYPSAYGLTDALDAWKRALNEAAVQGLPFVGPSMWDGLSGSYWGRTHEIRDADINRLAQYVNETKNHASMFTWSWLDEPDLGDYSGYAPPFVVRSWTYKCHQLDPQHLVFHGFVGYDYSPQASLWHEIQEKKFCYVHNKDMFGGKRTFVNDIYGFDYFPYDYYGKKGGHVSVADMVLAIKNMREWTHDLVPFSTAVEIMDIRHPDTNPPTPAQVRHIAWLNVIHGAKMIFWFLSPNPPENAQAMAEFKDHITQLTPVILGPEIDRQVTDDADMPAHRVDTMIREYNGDIYIIAVRLTEPPEEFDPAISVTFNVEGITDGTAEVFDESRTVNVEGGIFQDSFVPNAVHIYKIPVAGSAVGPAIVNHTAVDEFDQIPDYYINEVKRMLLSYPGESHGRGMFYGLELLEAQDSGFAVNSTWSGAPESPTDQHLRIFRAHWTGSGWDTYGGEEDTWTNQTAINRINNHFAYCKNILNNNVDAFAFGWCWDMTWHNVPGGGVDPVYNVRWAGSSMGGPNGDLRWGLDDGDTALTGNSVNMQTYLDAWNNYEQNNPDTAIMYSTGPVDGGGNTGERGYQRYLKHEFIRDWVGNNENRYLFDYADILTHNNAGDLYTTTWDSHTYPYIHPDNVGNYDGGDGGCHISQEGCLRLAKAMWVLLAKQAGWDGGTGTEFCSLNININGSGSVTKDPDKESYNLGEVVSLQANPASDYIFDSWSGDLSSTDNPATITMDSNKNITANFIFVDVTHPSVVSVNATETSVRVVFNEPLDVTSATNIANYSITGITGDIAVQEASLNVDTVTLTTLTHTEGTYTLTVENVQDISYNPMPRTPVNYQYTPIINLLYLNCDNNIDDQSGNNNNGVWNGTESYGQGILNQALSLDGTSTGSYVLVNHSDTLDGMQQLTLSMWAKKNNADVGGTIFLKHVVYRLEIASNGVSGYLLNGSGNRLDFSTTSASIDDTGWHHYALTYDGTTVRLYIDGQQISSQSFSGHLAVQPARDVYIGKIPWGTAFGGLLDEVRIYNRALTADEVLNLVTIADSWEPDDTASQANWLGSQQTHRIVPAGDVDWLKFLLVRESGVIIETSGAAGNTQMWLYDSSMNQIEYKDDGGTGSFSLIDRLCDVDALPAGTYYVAIDEYGNDDEIPSYDITLTVTACVAPQIDEPLPIFRFWSPINSRHFYTIGEPERNKLFDKYPQVWTYESIAYYAFETDSVPGLMPVYRFWSPVLVAHFYTISESERDKLINNYPHVWTYEGIAFYAYPEGQQPGDAEEVYRFWSPVLETHFYTMNETEKNKLVDNYSHVWTYEGIAWYAYE